MKKLVIIMGVSGCGKSTLAKRLAKRLCWQFLDADDFHSPEAKQQMAKGIPLQDAQRLPWLNRICDFLTSDQQHTVLAYSGLRRAHRQLFRELDFETLFILLDGDFQTILLRMQKRQGHFAKESLLKSQFESLQKPDCEPDCVTINNDQHRDIVEEQIFSAVNLLNSIKN